MPSTFKQLLCRLLAVTMLMLPFQYGQAGMIGTDQINAASSAQLERNVVSNFLNRSQTADQFRALGVDAQAASDRVAAMTDDEVRTLAGKISAVPAGADGSILLVLVIIGLVWYFAFRR